jgi:hypothetical protein
VRSEAEVYLGSAGWAEISRAKEGDSRGACETDSRSGIGFALLAVGKIRNRSLDEALIEVLARRQQRGCAINSNSTRRACAVVGRNLGHEAQSKDHS